MMKRPDILAMDELESMLRDMQEMEQAIRGLKNQIHEMPARIAAQIESEEEKLETALYLYWMVSEVAARSIKQHLLAGDENKYRAITAAMMGIDCDRCGQPVKFRSRTHLQEVIKAIQNSNLRYAEGYKVLCDPCWQEVQAERHEEWKAQEIQRRRRLYQLKTMPYREYLQTPEWQARRQTHLKSAGYRCQVCNASGVTLNVHHRTYERRGEEYYKDLLVLCQNCHEIFHREGKVAE